jgi:pyridoxal phosphate enzyme (YggS family)
VAASIRDNLQRIRAEIAAAAQAARRNVDSITVIAVSKGHDVASVRAAAAAGVSHFGESYAQEAGAKATALADLKAVWHFIGRLQANKTRAVAEQFDWVHSVDRLRIAERLSAQRPHYAPPLQICLQINIAGEDQKAGVAPPAAAELARAVASLPRLQLRGLMCILPADQPAAINRQRFASLRHLQLQLNGAGGNTLDTLSMGMSADFRDAILEGATLVRIGTAIFGPRTPVLSE